MPSLSELAVRLKAALRLELEPVGVKLVGPDDRDPDFPDGPPPEIVLKSYCQGLTMAARGRTFYGPASSLGCTLGTVALGLEKDPAPLLAATAQEKAAAGLFRDEDASRSSVSGAPRLTPGSSRAALISPLADLTAEPDVVILEVTPEQAMWLLYAANYQSGGGQNLPQAGGVAGGCADVTAYPLLTGSPNITFLGLACRLKSAIPAGHLFFGLPGSGLEELLKHLEKMAKPIGKLAEASRAN